MTANQPLDLDAIEARAARLYERTASIDPNAHPDFGQLTDSDVPALIETVRRLSARVAAFTTLADRWQQMADHGDVAIGSFQGPAAATLDAEVGERGRTYRKAAADIRDVLATGHIPHDLMTDDELDAAAPVVRSDTD